ncbi:uncharacterized protein LOC118202028 [Stegodyphus dumicola]|uniref:uncharacterized protein LOC118202028 n=1 Tax=Stegodyphus dumicola TaxID=202533 RepID=UPI0015B24744|nr:uncharacterized protein LOC118202028 [Stegodyphus dumicola]
MVSLHMAIKYGILLIYSASPISQGEWITSRVILKSDGKLETESQVNNETLKKIYILSPDWFIVTPRHSFNKGIPPLPENKHPEQLFALTQPPDTTIWFLGNSKYER